MLELIEKLIQIDAGYARIFIRMIYPKEKQRHEAIKNMYILARKDMSKLDYISAVSFLFMVSKSYCYSIIRTEIRTDPKNQYSTRSRKLVCPESNR